MCLSVGTLCFTPAATCEGFFAMVVDFDSGMTVFFSDIPSAVAFTSSERFSLRDVFFKILAVGPIALLMVTGIARWPCFSLLYFTLFTWLILTWCFFK